MRGGLSSGDWSALGNTWKLFVGNFYLDRNRNFFGQTWQGISRFSWELPQSTIGHSASQLRNAYRRNGYEVDRVEYFGGATYAIDENSSHRNGVSLGNFININIRDNIRGSFKERLISDPLAIPILLLNGGLCELRHAL